MDCNTPSVLSLNNNMSNMNSVDIADCQYDGFLLSDYVFSDDEVDDLNTGADYGGDPNTGADDQDHVDDQNPSADYANYQKDNTYYQMDVADDQNSDSDCDSMPGLCSDFEEVSLLGSDYTSISEYPPHSVLAAIYNNPSFSEPIFHQPPVGLHTDNDIHDIDWWGDWERSLMYNIHVIKGGDTPEEFDEREREYELGEYLAYDMPSHYY